MLLRKYIDIVNEAYDIGQTHKVSKEEANYVDRSMSVNRCNKCVHFRSPFSCEIVAGEISPDGWCKYFKHI